jgi:predicted nucleic acid-binding protein
MILVDSCIWIDFLSGRSDHDMQALLAENKVAVCGTVMAQVLSGVRGVKNRSLLEQRMSALPYLPETREVFVRGADLYSELRRKGVTVPLSDCVIAAVCMINRVPLESTDAHFEHFAGLKRC